MCVDFLRPVQNTICSSPIAQLFVPVRAAVNRATFKDGGMVGMCSGLTLLGPLTLAYPWKRLVIASFGWFTLAYDRRPLGKKINK